MDAVTAAEATATDAARRKEAATQALREASERTPALEQDYLDWKLAVGMTLDPHKPPSQSQAELEEQIRALQAKMQKLQAEWAVRAMSPWALTLFHFPSLARRAPGGCLSLRFSDQRRLLRAISTTWPINPS